MNCRTKNVSASNVDRRHSLTKYQIDSSEYVQPKVDESLMRSYTDYEKARQNEYKLNIFSTVSSHISSETSPDRRDSEREQSGVIYGDDKSISIKTAQTKNDWIQEWAKNARRCNNILSNSEAVSPKLNHYSKTNYQCPQTAHLQSKNNSQMPQSHSTCFYQIEKFGDGTIESSSDECMTKKQDKTTNWSSTENFTSNDGRRPPISPTKIPSPMHTHLRTRSSSANRSFRHSNVVSYKIHFYIRVIFKSKYNENLVV